MAQANKDQVNVTIVDGERPSTSKEESPKLQKEHRKLSEQFKQLNIPSWHFGQPRKSSVCSSEDSQTEEKNKIEVPNVLRSSMVELQIIPPLPRLSMTEEMDDKLSRMLKKLDVLMLTKPLEENFVDPPAAKKASKFSDPSSSKAKTE